MNFTAKNLLVCLFLATNYICASENISRDQQKTKVKDDDHKQFLTIHYPDGTSKIVEDERLYFGGSKTSDIVERSSNRENEAVFRQATISKDPKYNNHQEVQTIYYADGHSETFVHEGQVQLTFNDGEIRHKNCCNIN